MSRVLMTTDYLHPGDDVHTLLRKHGHQVNYRPAVGPRDPDETLALFDGVHGAIVASEPITADMLDHAPELKVLARSGVGYDSIDVAAAAHGIQVCNTPGVNHDAVAGVDQNRGGFHRAQCLAADDPVGGGVGSGVQAQVVRGGDDGVAVDEVHGGFGGVGVGGVDEHGHPERGTQAGHRAPAGPVAQQAQGGAAQFVAGVTRPPLVSIWLPSRTLRPGWAVAGYRVTGWLGRDRPPLCDWVEAKEDHHGSID
jgi:hypothetical protein